MSSIRVITPVFFQVFRFTGNNRRRQGKGISGKVWQAGK
jgi:hypothetical protein